MWETQEDIARDLLLFAEYSTPPPDDNEPIVVPEAILKYRKQMEDNRRNVLNADLNEVTSATLVISGRGRGIQDRIVRPGETVQPHPIDDIELKKKIREVSGLGYSNELIQQTLEAARTSSEPSNSGASVFPDFTWSDPPPITSKSPTPTSPAKKSSTTSPAKKCSSSSERNGHDAAASSGQTFEGASYSNSSRMRRQEKVNTRKGSYSVNAERNPNSWRKTYGEVADKGSSNPKRTSANKDHFPPLK